MKNASGSLERQIEIAVERLVREHLAALEMAASAAVREGFRRAAQPMSKQRDVASTGHRRSPSRRRPREEVAALEERLYRAVCAHPGETMTALARAVGATARELNRPALVLRRDGRVRSVGQRSSTRYFPLGK
jgi:hypothetical protein